LLSLLLFCGCGNQKSYHFDDGLFAENTPVYDAVMGVYTEQSFITDTYTSPVIHRLDDTIIGRCEVLFADGNTLYLCQQDDTGFAVGAYAMDQKRFVSIFSDRDFTAAGMYTAGLRVSGISALISDRYLIFSVSEGDDEDILCSFDMTQKRLHIIHRSVMGLVEATGQKVYFIAFQNSVQTLMVYDPVVGKPDVVVADSCIGLTKIEGQIYYALTKEVKQHGEYMYYDLNGKRYDAADSPGRILRCSGGIMVSDVVLSADCFSEAISSFPPKYQILQQSSSGLAVAFAGEIKPLILPAGSSVLKNADTDGRFVVMDMEGDYLPRYYDANLNRMVIVGQLTGHDFTYRSFLTDSYIFIAAQSAITDGGGNTTYTRQVFAISKNTI